MYIKRLASKEIFSPTNKIYRELGRAKDLSHPGNNNNNNDVQSQYSAKDEKDDNHLQTISYQPLNPRNKSCISTRSFFSSNL